MAASGQELRIDSYSSDAFVRAEFFTGLPFIPVPSRRLRVYMRCFGVILLRCRFGLLQSSVSLLFFPTSFSPFCVCAIIACA